MKCVSAFFALIILLTAPAAAQNESSSPHGVLSSPQGRFAFGQLSEYASATYLLDTKSGRLWQIVEKESGREVLIPVWYQPSDDVLSVTPTNAPTVERKREEAVDAAIEKLREERETQNLNEDQQQ